jgi:hypothetical protein
MARSREIEYVVAGGKAHQLTGAGGGKRPRAFQRIDDSRAMNWACAGLGRLTQSEFGGGGQVLVEAG